MERQKTSFALLRKYVVLTKKLKNVIEQRNILEKKFSSKDEVSEKEFNKLISIEKEKNKIYGQMYMVKAKISSEYFQKIDVYNKVKDWHKDKLKFLAETPDQSL